MNKKFLLKTCGSLIGLTLIAASLTTPARAGVYDDWEVYFENYGGGTHAYGAISTCESQTGGECVIILDDCQGRGEIVISRSDLDYVGRIFSTGELLLVKPWSSMDLSSPVCAARYDN